MVSKTIFNASEVASSSSSKRNWSTYSIHSIKRNRLHSKNVEDLVFVHSKLWLLPHKENSYKQEDTNLLDIINSKHVKLDDPISHLAALGVDDDQELPNDHEVENASTTASGTICGSSNLS